jgi:predicted dithiol-disulfide oxidoreductase (DUF899 family)
MKWRSRLRIAVAASIHFLWLSTMSDGSGWSAKTRPGCSRLLSKAEGLSLDLGRSEVHMVKVRRADMAELLEEIVMSMPQR